jgi:putative transposase
MKSTVVEFFRPDQFSDELTELSRTEARNLIQQAVEAELAGFMEQFSGRSLDDGKAAVVCNGYHPERDIQTDIDPLFRLLDLVLPSIKQVGLTPSNLAASGTP